MNAGKTTAPEKDKDSPRQALDESQSHMKLAVFLWHCPSQDEPSLCGKKIKVSYVPKAFGIFPYLKYNQVIIKIAFLTTTIISAFWLNIYIYSVYTYTFLNFSYMYIYIYVFKFFTS